MNGVAWSLFVLFFGILALIVYLIARKPKKTYDNEGRYEGRYPSAKPTLIETFARQKQIDLGREATPGWNSRQMPYQQNNLLQCPYCGFMNEANAKICARCGSVLQSMQTRYTPQPPPPPEAKEEKIEEAEEYESENQSPKTEKDRERKKSKKYDIDSDEKRKYIEKLDRWEKFGFPTDHLRELMEEDMDEFIEVFKKTQKQLEEA